MEKILHSEVDIFHTTARILIAGFSGSGKSFFTSKLINLYKHKFSRIISIGSDLEQVDQVDIIRDDDFNPFLDHDGLLPILLIYDDIIFDAAKMKIACEVFIRGRHKNISVILISQNIFLQSKEFRCISLNCTHIILLRMRDFRQISHFSSTFLTQEKKEAFLKLYKLIVLKDKYQYLLIDFNKNFDSKLQLRTNLFGEGPEKCIQI